MRGIRQLAGSVVLVMFLAGCSGTNVDSACDVAGISQEVEHMVGEAHLEMTSLDALTCSGAWAFAKATVAGAGQAAQTSTFLFQKVDGGWFLKAPEIACGGDPGLPTVPAELKADACPAA